MADVNLSRPQVAFEFYLSLGMNPDGSWAEGLSKPLAWSRTIRTDSGQPDRLAADILSWLISQYMPRYVTDPDGRVTIHQAAPEEWLETSVRYIGYVLTAGMRTVRRALARLEALGAIERTHAIAGARGMEQTTLYIRVLPDGVRALSSEGGVM